MRILFLSFYFRPDLSAGSFRSTSLVSALRAAEPLASIDIVTTLPNRYASFSPDAPSFENFEGMNIYRLQLPSHMSGIIDQCIAFFSFAFQAIKIVRKNEYDLVFVTSSRLMTAFLGCVIAHQKKALLYLDIRDIFVDTINDVLPRYLTFIFLPFFKKIEQWVIGRAVKVNLVSIGFLEYFRSRYPSKKFSFFTNGIDDDFILSVKVESMVHPEGGPLTVVYAGNIGEGQGLHNIIPNLSKKMMGRVNFRIIGDGGRKKILQEKLEHGGATNVILLPPMSRLDLIEEYKKADILFLHLNNHDAFKKVLPSKLFEYAAMGKPIWAGIPGYSAEFLISEISNAVVFSPCDAVEAEMVYRQLNIVSMPRFEFVQKFKRSNISREMAIDIINVAKFL